MTLLSSISYFLKFSGTSNKDSSSSCVTSFFFLFFPSSLGVTCVASLTSFEWWWCGSVRGSLRLGAVNEATWKELVLDCDIPVRVDFWAPWCGPCRMIAPLVDELAKLYAGRVCFLKRNTDESPNKATEYGIRSIPTVLILKKGEKKDAIVGAVSKATLVATVEKYLDR
ncbi:hypothetical protein KP509_34G032900 [Ceratopteris richardii]|uniref:Thioredoxin domain-containing protein n=1 Tax=Ceratopteris richardii TaxID=49495 RepID=A0A8T2QKC2_CERRI|nr:hypothetical protein KP509_34G032900 [Ceratopteris richardii]